MDGQGSSYLPLRAFRQVQHERLKKELFEHDKDARLRSGARGLAARKALVAFEKKFAESVERHVFNSFLEIPYLTTWKCPTEGRGHR